VYFYAIWRLILFIGHYWLSTVTTTVTSSSTTAAVTTTYLHH